jgi:hypothetical protein
MLTRTVSRRRWRAALQGARGEQGKRAEADEKRGDGDGPRRREARLLLRLAGAGRKPAAVAGPREETAGEATDAMGFSFSLRLFFSSSQPAIAIGCR